MRAIALLNGLVSLALLCVPLCMAHPVDTGNGPAKPPAPKTTTPAPKTTPVYLSFGVYQSDKATDMYRKFIPLIEAIQGDLELRLGRPTDIEMQIFKTYEDGIEALAKGKVDFVRFGPSPYILAKRKNPGLELLAMELEEGKKSFHGCVVVPRASKIQKLSDLRGKSFAFGDKNSTIGRFLVQELMLNEGLHARDLGRYEYLDRHDKVAAAVLAGDFDAGSVKESNFEESKGALRALVKFENVTKPWVARSGLDADVVAGLRAGLLDMKDSAALKSLKVSGFAPTSDAEYLEVQKSMAAAEAFEAPPQ
jgi:phosphonate transport system substrate-binding protein